MAKDEKQWVFLKHSDSPKKRKRPPKRQVKPGELVLWEYSPEENGSASKKPKLDSPESTVVPHIPFTCPVEAFFQGFTTYDKQRLLSVCSKDAILQIHGDPNVCKAFGEYYGHEGILRCVQLFYNTFQVVGYRMDWKYEMDQKWFCHVTFQGRLHRDLDVLLLSGVPYLFQYEMIDGVFQFTRVDEWPDTFELATQIGPTESLTPCVRKPIYAMQPETDLLTRSYESTQPQAYEFYPHFYPNVNSQLSRNVSMHIPPQRTLLQIRETDDQDPMSHNLPTR